MTITDIQKTKGGRYALFVDGAFLFSVHKDTFALSRLRTGLETDVQWLEQLRQEDLRRSCKDKALGLLSYAAHSRGNLLVKLRRFYPEEVAEETAQRMEELGLLNDLDYGLRLGSDLIHLRGWSRRRVEQELAKKLLDREVIAQVMEALEAVNQEGDVPRAAALIKKRYYQKIWDQKGLQSTIAALQRQGFALKDIKEALERIEQEEADLTHET